MRRRISPLSDEAVTRLLFDVGPRTVVLVEGKDDEEVFDGWYARLRHRLCFRETGGVDSVEKLLERVRAAGVTRVYGIVDRDFRPDEAVRAPMEDPDARLFVLPRYELENYLMEPAAVHEELVHNMGSKSAPTLAEVETRLLEICRQATMLAAGDWLLHENDAELLAIGFSRLTESGVLDQVEIRIGMDRKSLHCMLQKKLRVVEDHVASLDQAHVFVRGKRLLHWVLRFFKLKVCKDHLRRLLARAVMLTCGIHPDISSIIEGRILR